MYLVVLGFFLLLIGGCFVLAEIAKTNKVFGLIASLMLILVALWQWGDPVSVPTGSTMNYNQTIIMYNLSNVTNTTTTTTTYNQTSTDSYSPVTIPFFDFAQFLSMFLLCIGMGGMFKYASEFYLRGN